MVKAYTPLTGGFGTVKSGKVFSGETFTSDEGIKIEGTAEMELKIVGTLAGYPNEKVIDSLVLSAYASVPKGQNMNADGEPTDKSYRIKKSGSYVITTEIPSGNYRSQYGGAKGVGTILVNHVVHTRNEGSYGDYGGDKTFKNEVALNKGDIVTLRSMSHISNDYAEAWSFTANVTFNIDCVQYYFGIGKEDIKFESL